jgi:hypothetical protein
MFFSKSRKWKKVSGAVLAEVQPLMTLVERNTGKKISVVKDDNYFLGFITGMISLTMRRVGGDLTIEDKGMILFLVINQVYGDGVIDKKRLGDLLNSEPQRDEAFFKGFECYAKIDVLLFGRHKLHDDPDYIKALNVVRNVAGHTLNLISPGASEDQNVATLLTNQYFLEPIFERLGRVTL